MTTNTIDTSIVIIDITVFNSHIVVIGDIIQGSSAYNSHKLQKGDELISINSNAVKGMTLEQVETCFKEDRVVLEVARGMKRIQVPLFKQEITLQEGRVDTSYEKVAGGIIGVIALHSFYQGDGVNNSEYDVKEALSKLSFHGKIKALVLDLRDNRGGFLMQAVKVAGLFIKTGVVVVAKYGDGSLHYFRDLDPSVAYSGPLIVLVSKETASAAEIVAQSLKDYGVAIIVGDEHTYGKGSLQMQTVTGNGQETSYYKVTVGEYFGVSGESVQKSGLASDILVPGSLFEKKIGEEYLEGTIAKKTISPSFKDTLEDIPSLGKGWYMQYYLPFLQTRSNVLRKQIPGLAKKSKERFEKNQNYQRLLRGERYIVEGREKKTVSESEANKLLAHYQLKEAIAIAQDSEPVQNLSAS